MKQVTFIIGNQAKANYLAKYLDCPVAHRKVDLDEIQSLDLRAVVEHKARQAYNLLGTPVLVEDVALEFEALGTLPGTFIKFFLQTMAEADICKLVDGKSRAAVARCVFGYCDGDRLELFEGSLAGSVAERPAGDHGFGWDRLFIPKGYHITRAEMDEADDQTTYLQIKPLHAVKQFLLAPCGLNRAKKKSGFKSALNPLS